MSDELTRASIELPLKRQMTNGQAPKAKIMIMIVIVIMKDSK